MPRFAFKITETAIDIAAQLTGSDLMFPDDLYIVVDVMSPVKFHAKLMSFDDVVEECKKDLQLQVV